MASPAGAEGTYVWFFADHHFKFFSCVALLQKLATSGTLHIGATIVNSSLRYGPHSK